MTDRKKISEELDEAICLIFDNPEVGYCALRCQEDKILGSIGLRAESSVSASINPLQRIAMLRRKLENWVELKGIEINEYEEGDETIRIRSETLTTLMILRDLTQYFPEVETASRSEFEQHRRNL